MLANDMDAFLQKFVDRNGLVLIEKHIDSATLGRQKWVHIIQNDSLVTFSRYFPNKFPMVINDDTCYKERSFINVNSQENGHKYSGLLKYFIKDEVLGDLKLLGVKDLDWLDYTDDNVALTGSTGAGNVYPNSMYFCPEAMVDAVIGLQMNADMGSLLNRGILLEYNENEGYFTLTGIGNVSMDLNNFVVELCVAHQNLSSVSPTKMEILESLMEADLANFLVENLKYADGLETVYLNIDLKLDKLREKAERRPDIIEQLKESYVSASNDVAPLIWTV